MYTHSDLGEIRTTNERGKMLRDACLRSDVRAILEIGTLDGTGSTRVIIDALTERGDKSVCLTSVEAHQAAYAIAIKNVGQQPFRVNLLHGSLVHKDTPLLLVSLSQEEARWFDADLKSRITIAPFIFDQLALPVDLLVLDGGEFTTFNDYLLLRKHCRYLFLDDVNVRKNRLVLVTALQDGFAVLNRTEEGNGACLLSRET